MGVAHRSSSVGRAAVAALLALAPMPAPAKTPRLAHPLAAPDVDRFIVRRDQCDHFRGEEPYDKARGAFLSRKMAQTCSRTDAELAALRRKYRDDPATLTRLAGYEDTIE